jgi:predicted PurR-regulated permease PerM
LIAVVIGGSLLGIIGALIAIPVAAIIQLIVEETIYRRMDLSRPGLPSAPRQPVRGRATESPRSP